MTKLVDLIVSDGVATIILDDPATVNSIGIEMANTLRETFGDLETDGSIRVVLLRGAGDHFSSGGNLVDALATSREGPSGAFHFMASFSALIRTVFNFPKPIVSIVQGSAAGGSLGLILCTDIILLAHSAKLMQAFVHVGLAPDCGTSILLARRVGIGRAKELTFTGRRLSAQEAFAIGLGDALHTDDTVQSAGEELAGQIASKSPLCILQSKKVMQHSQFSTLDHALELEAAAQALLMQSEDFRSSVTRFLGR